VNPLRGGCPTDRSLTQPALLLLQVRRFFRWASELTDFFRVLSFFSRRFSLPLDLQFRLDRPSSSGKPSMREAFECTLVWDFCPLEPNSGSARLT
jgi:hypothetical protein